MTTQSKQIIDQALKLSIPERAEVAASLIASLDGEADHDAQAAWAAEVERRAHRAIHGESTGKDWPEVYQNLQQRLNSR